MLEYDGGNGNQSDLFLSGQTADANSAHRRHLFDPYTTETVTNEFILHHNGFPRTHLQQFSSLYDDPSNFYVDPSPAILSLNNSSRSSVGFMVVPNNRESGGGGGGGGGMMDLAATLGLQLGRRTNVSEDDSAVNGLLYRRSGFRVNAPKCQAERCTADLRNAKHYHRRHKVCEFHSKAATVVAAGLSQRFCQQCSRW